MIKTNILAIALILIFITSVNALEIEGSALIKSKGKQSTITGTIKPIIYEDFKGRERIEYSLVTEKGESYEISSKKPISFLSGEKVTISGLILEDRILAD